MNSNEMAGKKKWGLQPQISRMGNMGDLGNMGNMDEGPDHGTHGPHGKIREIWNAFFVLSFSVYSAAQFLFFRFLPPRMGNHEIDELLALKPARPHVVPLPFDDGELHIPAEAAVLLGQLG
jgi:hypothetical protein